MSVVERALDKVRRRGAGPAPVSPVDVVAYAPASTGSASPPPIATVSIAPDSAHTEPRLFIDRRALRLAGYLPETQQDRRFADEYRRIKRPLLELAFQPVPEDQADLPSPRLVMMASALPGDGKTFTSINLALSLAREKDSSVVLVDGDVAKPHVSKIFGVEDQPGLMDLLANRSLNVADLILPTDVAGLSILPAGTRSDAATELLSSVRMREIAAQIIARNPRCIALFDSPPLLVSSEANALATSMGHVVLVVRAGKTPRHAVVDAVESLGERVRVSVVLNQGRRGISEGRYGYGYGYAEGYGDQKAEG
ncbi:MAG: CpsD/CapB family tyrosine-protein kinase [Nevskiaceae bacterium]|jgi:exopolysaccharide/PEP-CTERM locus tyrosine autokinase|nr:CpsD/CapB family tyrosine-protein kinase [Nevskiaceae bacterium]